MPDHIPGDGGPGDVVAEAPDRAPEGGVAGGGDPGDGVVEGAERAEGDADLGDECVECDQGGGMGGGLEGHWDGARNVKVLPRPKTPSNQMIYEHRANNHHPY